YDVLRINSKFFHHFRSRRAQTETMQPDYFSVEADVLIPDLRHTRLNRDTLATFRRQNFLAIFFRFAIEPFHAWHRDDTRTRAQFFRGGERVLQFASARQNDQVERRAFLFRDVTTARHSFATQLDIDIIQERNDLAGERD